MLGLRFGARLGATLRFSPDLATARIEGGEAEEARTAAARQDHVPHKCPRRPGVRELSGRRSTLRPWRFVSRQEAIEWAEAHIDEYLSGDDDEAHGERLYVLYAKLPRKDEYIQIAGWDPTRSPDPPPDWNLRRRPLSP